MRGLIENTKDSIEKLSCTCAEAYKDCFTRESTEQWIRRFAKARYETIYAIQRDDYNNKLSQKYQKVFIDSFTQIILKYIKTLPKK